MAAPNSYKGWPLPGFFNQEGTDLFHELELEDDDVVMVSFPKAGTSWVHKIIHCLLRMNAQGELPEVEHDLGKNGQIYPDWLPAQVPDDPEWKGVGPDAMVGRYDFQMLASMPRPRLFSTHCVGLELLPKSLAKRGRVVYVTRNPKDCLNSLHYFRGEAKDGWLGNDKGPGSMKRFISGVNAYGGYSRHTLCAQALIDGPCAGRSLVVYYEELSADHSGGVKRLANFLKIPLSEEKLASVLRETSFEAMSGGSIGPISSIVCRKGVARDWMTANVSPSDWAALDAHFEEELGSCPIAQPHRKWMKVEEEETDDA